MKQQIAIYLRLSLEDVDKRTNKVKDESNSREREVRWNNGQPYPRKQIHP